jgi:hypothetical protein
MWRRLKEDRNEHYDNLDCSCWSDPRAMARFKEQPQRCSRMCCGNQRKYDGATLQERRVWRTEDLSDEWIEAIRVAKMSPEHDHLNALVDGD